MAKPFGQFAVDMAALAVTIERNAGRVVRRAALAADQAIVISTPVDTGTARANWRIRLGGPVQGTIEAYSPGNAGSTASENTNAALEQARKAVAAHRLGVSIWLSNPLEYIPSLNAGSSAQAPAMFIEKGLQAASQAVRGVRITI